MELPRRVVGRAQAAHQVLANRLFTARRRRQIGAPRTTSSLPGNHVDGMLLTQDEGEAQALALDTGDMSDMDAYIAAASRASAAQVD